MEKHACDLVKHNRILNNLNHLPRKMLSLYPEEKNLSEFLLHDLCNQECLDLEKAAYFIDNPDFDCLKGIVGLSRSEDTTFKDDIWQQSDAFCTYMSTLPFNVQVRSLTRESCKRNNKAEQDVVQELAHELGFKKPRCCIWNMKHDNHGIFIFEEPADYFEKDNYLQDSVYLFGFCPIHP